MFESGVNMAAVRLFTTIVTSRPQWGIIPGESIKEALETLANLGQTTTNIATNGSSL